MKKIILSLAAMAALISCVEEKGLEPQNPASNRLTIKATTTLATKTVLGNELPEDGISVRWEDTDVIKVFLKDSYSGTASADFSAVDVDGVNADFTGEFADEEFDYFDVDKVTDAYAIYPSSSVSDGEITHTLAEEQDGRIKSGMNLSYAALNADEVLIGTATSATFRNALALIQITVPEGVKYVSLSTGNYGDELAGTATYTYSKGVLTRSSISGYKRTVTLKDGDAPLAAGTYSLLVFPSTKNNTLTLKMEGTDGAVYEKSLDDIKLMASQCYTINLEKLSYVGEVLPASPVGGDFVIPFVTTEDYTYSVEVEIKAGDDENWIRHVETRGFHKDEIVLALETNDSGKERSANVTVTIENVGSKTFVVSQANAFMDFVYTEENPIKWQEKFEVYPSEEDAGRKTNKIAEYSNIFTISLTTGDERKLGTYKIQNIFKTDKYISAQGQVAGKGGVYYANYSNNELILSVDEGETSYFFGKEASIVLTYDSNNKKFTSGNLLFSGNPLSDVWKEEGVIANYSATEYKEQVSADITGTYSASGKYGFSAEYTSTAFSDTFTIIANNDAKGQYKITGLFNAFGGGGGTYYANFADNVLTILAANSTHDNLLGGGLPNDVTMNYSNGTFTIKESILIETVMGIYIGKDYTATKQ